jgi:hypothetical protein
MGAFSRLMRSLSAFALLALSFAWSPVAFGQDCQPYFLPSRMFACTADLLPRRLAQIPRCSSFTEVHSGEATERATDLSVLASPYYSSLSVVHLYTRIISKPSLKQF